MTLPSSARFLDVAGEHAGGILLYGPEGAGKRAAAERLAKSLLCPNCSEGAPCGECPVCRSFHSGRAVDLLLIRPRGAGAQIKVRAVTAARGGAADKDDDDEGPPPTPILQYLQTRPLMARHKVILIDPAERMTPEASNALLKTLEEPEPHARIILVTSQFAKVMATIRSRCTCVAVGIPGPDDVGAETRAERLFGRSPRGVAAVRDSAEAYDALLVVMDAVPASPRAAALRLAEEFHTAVERLAKAADLAPRNAHREALRCLGEWVVAHQPDRPEHAHAVVEAHRLIDGNVGAGAVYDALFGGLLD